MWGGGVRSDSQGTLSAVESRFGPHMSLFGRRLQLFDHTSPDILLHLAVSSPKGRSQLKLDQNQPNVADL